MSETLQHPAVKKSAPPVPFKLKDQELLMIRNNRVYISGPISNIPDLNRPEFDRAEKLISKLGYTPINALNLIPAEDQVGMEWDFAMRVDVGHLLPAGIIYMMKGWQNSSGAAFEFITAKALNIPVVDSNLQLIYLTSPDYEALFNKVMAKIHENDLRQIKSIKRI